MIDKILSVTNKELDAIDLSPYMPFVSKSTNNSQYFLKKSGAEHYRLLAYISSVYDSVKLLDIGTNLGFSALALSDNNNNTVVSYDIVKTDMVKLYEIDPIKVNITFKIGNFLERENLHDYPFIFLDTAHEGPFERLVINHLKSIGWTGILGMDDVFEYKPLTDLWNSLDLKKYDLTSKGHCTGTGFIVYG